MSEIETAQAEPTTTILFDEAKTSAIAQSFGLDATDKEAVQALTKALNHAGFTAEEAGKLGQEAASGTLSDASKQLLGSKIQFEQGLTPVEKEKLMQWMTQTAQTKPAEAKSAEPAKPGEDNPPITIDAKDATKAASAATNLAAQQEVLREKIKAELEAKVRPAATQFQQLGEKAEGLQKEQVKLAEEGRSAVKKTALVTVVVSLAAAIGGYVFTKRSDRAWTNKKGAKVAATLVSAFIGSIISSVAALNIFAKPVERKMRGLNDQQQVIHGGMQQAQEVMNAGIQEVTGQFKPEVDALQQQQAEAGEQVLHASRVARRPSISEIASQPPAESLAENVKASQVEAAGAARA